MARFVMLMKGSAPGGDWDGYVESLIAKDAFGGGSSLGNGLCVSKEGESQCSVTGYIRITASDFAEARQLLQGNPVYETGGEIELLEEVRT